VPSTAGAAEKLLAVRDELAVLDARRAALLVERDRQVKRLRAGGVTWLQVERLAGCSRPALLKRGL